MVKHLKVILSLLLSNDARNNCWVFERLFQIQKNGIFLFRIPFLVFEILTFLYYANKETGDIMR